MKRTVLLVLAGLFVVQFGAWAMGQSKRKPNIRDRVELLESQMADIVELLELRKELSDSRFLEVNNKIAALAETLSDDDLDMAVKVLTNLERLENWKQVRDGMTTKQVRALLGKPQSITHGDNVQTWSYRNGSVSFDHGRVWLYDFTEK